MESNTSSKDDMSFDPFIADSEEGAEFASFRFRMSADRWRVRASHKRSRNEWRERIALRR